MDCATQIIIQWHEEAEIVMQLCVVERMVPALNPTQESIPLRWPVFVFSQVTTMVQKVIVDMTVGLVMWASCLNGGDMRRFLVALEQNTIGLISQSGTCDMVGPHTWVCTAGTWQQGTIGRPLLEQTRSCSGPCT
jgi:hypothetical protein